MSNSDYWDAAEYGNLELTTDQYKYIAEQLITLLADDNNSFKRYYMLLVEMGENKVSQLLGHALIYGASPAAGLFWDMVETERANRNVD